ncbi:MAG: hypothetical protein A2156_15070 [Deltaproteobacteria bacterium RBG_16_48_10]|nr:MAG: hypothetical protein A2156_15070 [Deltaproteobacteria bacterium RBG_16_48_10]
MTPIEGKICRSFKSTNSILKPGCLICSVIHSNTRFLISSPSPLRWGKVGMGVDVLDIPPHLDPPPLRGEEFTFFDSIGVWKSLSPNYIFGFLAVSG